MTQHLDDMTAAEINTRLTEWQRTANNPALPAHIRRAARRAVQLHRDALTARA